MFFPEVHFELDNSQMMIRVCSGFTPVLGVDANVVPLRSAGLEADAGGGGERVQAALDDGLLTRSCGGRPGKQWKQLNYL